MNYLACHCPHCDQKLEYPDDAGGQVVACPNCRGEMALPTRPEAQSFLGLLSAKLQEVRQSREGKRTLKAVLLEVVADGVLTASEMAQVGGALAETGLTAEDIRPWRKELFAQAVRSLDTHGADLGRLAGIRAIQSYLGLSDHEIGDEHARLQRCELLAVIREQGPPPVRAAHLVTRSGEQVYWVERARLFEEKFVSRRYEGGSQGVSIRVMKGVSFRLGSHRGRLVSDTATLPVSDGEFIVTSQRLVFRGSAKSFETKFKNLLDVCNHVDGIVFSEANRQKQRRVQYLSPNGDAVAEVLSYALARHAAESLSI